MKSRIVKEFRKYIGGYPDVVVMDVRDLLGGDYTVEQLVGADGYTITFSSPDLDKCLIKAQEVFDSLC